MLCHVALCHVSDDGFDAKENERQRETLCDTNLISQQNPGVKTVQELSVDEAKNLE
jgi:hypothetical protein